MAEKGHHLRDRHQENRAVAPLVTRLKIIQHNVRKWSTNKFSIINAYSKENPDVILINSHGMMNEERIKMWNYDVHQVNKNNEDHRGAAIAVRCNLKYKLIDNFYSDMIGVRSSPT